MSRRPDGPSRPSGLPAPWFVLAFPLLGVANPAISQTITLDTLSLHRLPGVRVEIEPYAGAAHRDGLDPDSLRYLIESKLADAGIAVLTEDEWQVTIGNPLLLVRIDLIRPSDFLYLYALRLELKQLVVLARDSTIPAFSATWTSESRIGSVQTANLPSLRWHVAEQVDRFIAAQAAANRPPYRWVRPAQPRDTVPAGPINDPSVPRPEPGSPLAVGVLRDPGRARSTDPRKCDRAVQPSEDAVR